MKDRTFITGVTCFAVLGMATAIYTQRPPSVQPFTAQRTDVLGTRALRDGTGQQVAYAKTIAVRSDGSISKTIEDRTTGTPAKMQVIDDVSTGEHIITDERTRTRSTWYLSQKQLEKNTAHPASTCKGIPAGKFLGFEVYLEESDETVRVPDVLKSHVKSWAAPKLNCFPLRYEQVNTTSEGEGFNTQVVTAVALGEPPAALFQVDPDFVETPPSRYNEQLSQLFPEAYPPHKHSIDIDRAYWSSRQNRRK